MSANMHLLGVLPTRNVLKEIKVKCKYTENDCCIFQILELKDTVCLSQNDFKVNRLIYDLL